MSMLFALSPGGEFPRRNDHRSGIRVRMYLFLLRFGPILEADYRYEPRKETPPLQLRHLRDPWIRLRRCLS